MGERLRLGAGATWLDATQHRLSLAHAAQQGNRIAFASRWQAVLHVHYDVAAVSGLSLYGVVRYLGNVWHDSANTLKLPGYTLVDIGGNYQVRAFKHNLVWRLSVENVVDRAYWGYNRVGMPRTYSLSVAFEL